MVETIDLNLPSVMGLRTVCGDLILQVCGIIRESGGASSRRFAQRIRARGKDREPVDTTQGLFPTAASVIRGSIDRVLLGLMRHAAAAAAVRSGNLRSQLVCLILRMDGTT